MLLLAHDVDDGELGPSTTPTAAGNRTVRELVLAALVVFAFVQSSGIAGLVSLPVLLRFLVVHGSRWEVNTACKRRRNLRIDEAFSCCTFVVRHEGETLLDALGKLTESP